MASGDVIFEFPATQLRSLSIGNPSQVGTRLRFPYELQISLGESALIGDGDFLSASLVLTGSLQTDDVANGDAERTGFRSLLDGTKRYKITVSEV